MSERVTYSADVRREKMCLKGKTRQDIQVILSTIHVDSIYDIFLSGEKNSRRAD